MKENVSERKVVYILYKKCLCVYDTDLNVGTLGSWETEINNKDNIKKKSVSVCILPSWSISSGGRWSQTHKKS